MQIVHKRQWEKLKVVVGVEYHKYHWNTFPVIFTVSTLNDGQAGQMSVLSMT